MIWYFKVYGEKIFKNCTQQNVHHIYPFIYIYSHNANVNISCKDTLFYLTVFFRLNSCDYRQILKNKPNIKYLTNIWYMLGHVCIRLYVSKWLFFSCWQKNIATIFGFPDGLTKKHYKNCEKGLLKK